MKFALCLLALSCGAVGFARAAEKPPVKTTKPAPVLQTLQKLKAQCDNPNAAQQLAWPSSVSETEFIRCQAIEELKAEKDGLENVRRELGTAKGEYRQMLVIALAVLGDKDAIAPAAKVMLSADKPAARVVAASMLARIGDKSLIESFKQAMTDEFQRERGGCLGPEMMIYPVRMFAFSGLVKLGLSREEIRKLGDWQVVS